LIYISPVSKRGVRLCGLFSAKADLPRLGVLRRQPGGLPQAFHPWALATHFCPGDKGVSTGSACTRLERALSPAGFAVAQRAIRRACLFSRDSFGLRVVKAVRALPADFGFGAARGFHWCPFGLVRLGRAFTLLGPLAFVKLGLVDRAVCRTLCRAWPAGFVIKRRGLFRFARRTRLRGALGRVGIERCTVPGPRAAIRARGCHQSGNRHAADFGARPPAWARATDQEAFCRACHKQPPSSTFSCPGQVRWVNLSSWDVARISTKVWLGCTRIAAHVIFGSGSPMRQIHRQDRYAVSAFSSRCARSRSRTRPTGPKVRHGVVHRRGCRALPICSAAELRAPR